MLMSSFLPLGECALELCVRVWAVCVEKIVSLKKKPAPRPSVFAVHEIRAVNERELNVHEPY